MNYDLIHRGDCIFQSTLEKIHDGCAIIFTCELKLLHGENKVAQTAGTINLALELHLHFLLTLW